MRLFLASAVAALAALPAAAQIDPAAAFPLAVGNAWEFNDGSLRWDVVGERTVGGERVALLQFDGGPTCGVRTVAVNGGYQFPLVDPADVGAPCTAAVRFPGYYAPGDLCGFSCGGGPFVVGEPQPFTFRIDGVVVADSAWFTFDQTGMTGPRYEGGHNVTEGIGPVDFVRYRYPNPPVVIYDFELTYVRIDGVATGIPTAADEGPPAGALGLSVGPNPAGARATLRFTLAEAAAVWVGVVDALGREVLTADVGPVAGGPASVALDTVGLAPGVYVVRVVAGAASASVRLVVAR